MRLGFGGAGRRTQAVKDVVYGDINKFVLSRWFGGIVFFLLLSSSLVSKGAVNPIMVAIVTGLFGVLACVGLATLGEPRATLAVFRTACIVASLLVGWGIIQTLPIDKLANPIWRDLADTVPLRFRTISVAPADSRAALVPLVLPFVVFIGALVLFPSDDEAQRLLSWIGKLGGVLAILAICEFQFSPRTLLLDDKKYYLDSLTAPFVNRNTAGTFYGVVSLLLMARVIIEARQTDFRSLVVPNRWAPENRRLSWSVISHIGLATAALVALFLTKSRGGIGATFVAYLLFVPLALYSSQKGSGQRASFGSGRRWRAWRLLRALLGLALVVVIGAVFADYALFRAEVQGLDDGRFCVAPAIIEAANANRATGVGFATFRLFFPAYRDPHCGILGVWDRAHSVYLEAYLGLGWIFWIALLIGVTALVTVFAKGILARRSLKIYPIVGLAALLLVMAHSLIDFSVQIPGFAAVFAVVMAALATISRGRAFIPPVRR